MSVDTNKETLGFQAEVRQLLDLLIHSLYSEKEIFLRELISNASDACDKLRFEALSDESLYEGDAEFRIYVGYDKKKKTITVRDNGIGMSRQEVVDAIGTIAKSGTRQFFESLTGDQAKDTRLIGEFGVGFYSSFIVAERVVLTTRRAGLSPSEGVRWESEGEGEYTVEAVETPDRGTEVVLHLRKGMGEFLDGERLRAIIRKYSDHISLPILMPKEGEDAQGEETVNSATALWTRPKKEIAKEEYNEFYKHVAHDFEAPLAYIHTQVEGKLEYSSVLFIPSRAPFDLWDREHRHGIKLYVRRIFIMDDAEQLIPTYLRFVRGVVDSNDLPLNVSRQMLQRNKAINAIRAASVKKILGLLETMAKKDAEKYGRFWKQFGRVLKEGIVEDSDNRDRIAKLLRFTSTHDDKATQAVSLEDYVGRVQEGQKAIYYVIAESFDTAKNSPHLEIFRKKGIEVLVLSDGIDEWLVTYLTEFDGKNLQSVAKGELDLGEVESKDEKQQVDDASDKYKDLLERIKNELDDKVKEVRITNRLTSSPACLVTDEHEIGGHLQRLLKAAGQQADAIRPILEINPEHPIVVRLNDEKNEKRIADWSRILFDQALLSEGGQLDDPAGFVHRLNEIFLVISGEQGGDQKKGV
ncbi:MAG: molecular chaperone HtpG [Gammaproteobacteria bacterium]